MHHETVARTSTAVTRQRNTMHPERDARASKRNAATRHDRDGCQSLNGCHAGSVMTQRIRRDAGTSTAGVITLASYIAALARSGSKGRRETDPGLQLIVSVVKIKGVAPWRLVFKFSISRLGFALALVAARSCVRWWTRGGVGVGFGVWAERVGGRGGEAGGRGGSTGTS